MSSGKPKELWPLWLAADIPGLGVWVVEYDSAPTLWRGHSIARADRANNVLALLLSEERFARGDCFRHAQFWRVFEQILRIANERLADMGPTARSVGTSSRHEP
jgi:hypothetical protein